MNNFKVAIIMGSKTDLKVMKNAGLMLKSFNIPFDTQIVSAHRTPQEMYSFAATAAKKYSVIIAGAGGSAHLPGMVAAMTTLPVIGVPVTVGKMKGIDALLSIVQMPKGVPVATVAIDNAENAAILAARIISIFHSGTAKKLLKFQQSQRKKVKAMNKEIRKK